MATVSNSGFGINGVLPGSGTCVAGGCGRTCARSVLMCRPHSASVPTGLRQNLRFVWSRWQRADASLQDVRDAQMACVEAIEHP